MKFIKIDLFLAFIILISLYTWRHIPFLQFVGEGYTYFEPSVARVSFNQPLPHDLLAKVLFNFLPSVFQEKVNLYMQFLFLVMITINVIFYLVVKGITGKKSIGFLSSLLFTTSFTGNFDMYSAGGYQYFVQRGILLVFLLPAFYFLVLYFNGRFPLKYYIASLLFYTLGILSGFFATWFLPVFIFYPLSYLALNFRKFKKFPLRVILSPLPFITSNFLLIKESSFIPGEESLLKFIFDNSLFSIIGILQQLTVITFPLGELLKIADRNSLQFLTVLGLTAVLYLGILVINLKIRNDNKVLQLTAISSLTAMLIFNLYLNSATVLNTTGSSRYFYYPFVMAALFWGTSLNTFFSSKKSYLPVGILCLIWIFANMVAIRRNLANDEFLQRANRQTLEFLDRNALSLRQYPSVIHLPGIGPYGASFVTRYYSHPDGRLILQGLEALDLEKLRQEKVNPDRLYVLYYDPSRQIVIDKTEESRGALMR